SRAVGAAHVARGGKVRRFDHGSKTVAAAGRCMTDDRAAMTRAPSIEPAGMPPSPIARPPRGRMSEASLMFLFRVVATPLVIVLLLAGAAARA
ncbi:hypothetical protein ACTGY2_11135, partial [Streptococcus suis]